MCLSLVPYRVIRLRGNYSSYEFCIGGVSDLIVSKTNWVGNAHDHFGAGESGADKFKYWEPHRADVNVNVYV